jgi:hypothetical protein
MAKSLKKKPLVVRLRRLSVPATLLGAFPCCVSPNLGVLAPNFETTVPHVPPLPPSCYGFGVLHVTVTQFMAFVTSLRCGDAGCHAKQGPLSDTGYLPTIPLEVKLTPRQFPGRDPLIESSSSSDRRIRCDLLNH